MFTSLKFFLQLAKKFHPDSNKGDKAAAMKFSEVAEAYEVLGDSKKRQEYDMMGAARYQAEQQSGGGSAWNRSGFSGQMNPEDLFRKIFEEFAGSASGGTSYTFHNMTEFTPLEVSAVYVKQ